MPKKNEDQSTDPAVAAVAAAAPVGKPAQAKRPAMMKIKTGAKLVPRPPAPGLLPKPHRFYNWPKGADGEYLTGVPIVGASLELEVPCDNFHLRLAVKGAFEVLCRDAGTIVNASKAVAKARKLAQIGKGA